MRAEWECGSAWPLPAESLPARLPVESLCESAAQLPAESPCESAESRVAQEEATRSRRSELASR